MAKAKPQPLAACRGSTDAQVTNKLRLARVADTADHSTYLMLKAAALQDPEQFQQRAAYSIQRVAAYVVCELGTDAALAMLAIAGAAIEEVPAHR